MKDRDASDENAEFARQMEETARARAQYAQTVKFCDFAHRDITDLMRETERIAKWDRWMLPLSLLSLTFTVITLCVVWNR